MTVGPVWPHEPQKIDIQARKLYLEFALMNLDSDETSRDICTGVLHRISIPFIWAEWFGLGSHFWKNAKVLLFWKYAYAFFQEQSPKMVSAPNVPTRKEHVNTNIYIRIYIYIYICIYIYKYIYLTWAPSRPPPARAVPGPCKVCVFVYVYAYLKAVGFVSVWLNQFR